MAAPEAVGKTRQQYFDFPLCKEAALKNRWLVRLAEINKEFLLMLSIIGSLALLNFFVSGQRMVLMFYNLPTLAAAYYFGRKRAVEAAIASVLFVVWMNLLNPAVLGSGVRPEAQALLTWSDLVIWSSFLLISAYVTGTLYDDSKRRLSELRETYHGVLQILSQFISNDKFTQNHSYRVSVYATQIALEMRLADEKIEDIRAAALLHDIGKLETSRKILYKAARLTEDEMTLIKTHVEKGIDLLSPVGGSLRRILPIVLAHHDKFDGSGYHTQKGEDIPVESRIISVADVYDSLISDRPYRKAISPFEARDTIRRGAGTDFDPRVVAAFESSFRKQRLEVPEVLV